MFSLGGIPSGLYFIALILELQFYDFPLGGCGAPDGIQCIFRKNMKAATGLNRGLGLQDLECVSVS